VEATKEIISACASRGVLLKTEDGKGIKVGPESGRSWDIDVLPGHKPTDTAADFDRDGTIGLILGGRFGNVRYDRNVTGAPIRYSQSRS
jgi:hypothetical protein